MIPGKISVVVGDIHGEFEGLRDIMIDARLIDGSDRWIGGDSVLIQTGGVIGRGPY